ncbi:GTP-binding [Batrachochytrium dendrobatidis]|nr:GTP-binding [Batrachochytrium dendrobatidis]
MLLTEAGNLTHLNVLVLGPPHTGKTTLCNTLLRGALVDQPKVINSQSNPSFQHRGLYLGPYIPTIEESTTFQFIVNPATSPQPSQPTTTTSPVANTDIIPSAPHRITITLIDLGGHPLYYALWPSVIAAADAFMLTYDVGDKQSLQSLWKYYRLIVETKSANMSMARPDEIPMLLVGSMVDTVTSTATDSTSNGNIDGLEFNTSGFSGKKRPRQVSPQMGQMFADILRIPHDQTTSKAPHSIAYCFRKLVAEAQRKAAGLLIASLVMSPSTSDANTRSDSGTSSNIIHTNSNIKAHNNAIANPQYRSAYVLEFAAKFRSEHKQMKAGAKRDANEDDSKSVFVNNAMALSPSNTSADGIPNVSTGSTSTDSTDSIALPVTTLKTTLPSSAASPTATTTRFSFTSKLTFRSSVERVKGAVDRMSNPLKGGSRHGRKASATSPSEMNTPQPLSTITIPPPPVPKRPSNLVQKLPHSPTDCSNISISDCSNSTPTDSTLAILPAAPDSLVSSSSGFKSNHNLMVQTHNVGRIAHRDGVLDTSAEALSSAPTIASIYSPTSPSFAADTSLTTSVFGEDRPEVLAILSPTTYVPVQDKLLSPAFGSIRHRRDVAREMLHRASTVSHSTNQRDEVAYEYPQKPLPSAPRREFTINHKSLCGLINEESRYADGSTVQSSATGNPSQHSTVSADTLNGDTSSTSSMGISQNSSRIKYGGAWTVSGEQVMLPSRVNSLSYVQSDCDSKVSETHDIGGACEDNNDDGATVVNTAESMISLDDKHQVPLIQAPSRKYTYLHLDNCIANSSPNRLLLKSAHSLTTHKSDLSLARRRIQGLLDELELVDFQDANMPSDLRDINFEDPELAVIRNLDSIRRVASEDTVVNTPSMFKPDCDGDVSPNASAYVRNKELGKFDCLENVSSKSDTATSKHITPVVRTAHTPSESRTKMLSSFLHDLEAEYSFLAPPGVI